MPATGSTRGAVRPKEFHFPLSVEWIGERRVAAQVEGKSAIEIAPPPVFRGTDPATWSPEDFLVAAAASCLASVREAHTGIRRTWQLLSGRPR